MTLLAIPIMALLGIISLILSAAGVATQAGIEAHQGKKNREHQQQMQESQEDANINAMSIQHDLNEQSANAADERTRALYNDFKSPKAMVKQYEEAGLSPALMYGMTGSSGANMTNGAQANGTGLGTVGGASGNIFSGSEVGVMLSQIRLNEAKAREADAAAGKFGAETITENQTREFKIGELEAKISLMKEQAKTEETKQDLNRTQVLFQEAEIAITNLHYDQEKESWGYQLEYIKGTIDRQAEEVRELIYRNDFTKESWQDMRQQIKLENQQLIANIANTASETKLNEKELTHLDAIIERTWKEVYTEKWRGINEQQLLERFHDQLRNDRELAEIYGDNEVRAKVVGGITQGLSTAAMMLIFRGGARPAPIKGFGH